MLHQEETRAKKLTEYISDLLHSTRFFLLILVGLIFAAMLFYLIYSEVSKGVREKSTVLAEQAEELYTEWKNTDNEDQKDEIEATLKNDLRIIIKAYPGQYATQRALLTRGNVSLEKEEWKLAKEDFLLLYRTFPKSYLGGEGLFKAAICSEEAGDYVQAITEYIDFTENYTDSPRLPHALFSIGRLYEITDDYQGAQEIYNRLRLDFQNSNWTNYAINRIIDLKIQGKIEE